MARETKEKKERKLTEAEQRRLDAFSATCDELTAKGYTRVNLQISLAAANIIAVVALLVLFVILLPLFFLLHPESDFALSATEFLIYLVVVLILTAAHELVHGLVWSLFAPDGFKSISFGIIWSSLAPYCTCRVPLPKKGYLLGSLAPLVVFGILPLVIAFATGFIPLLYIGVIMTVAATGDVMIVLKVLAHKPPAGVSEILLYDHPTEAGSVIFER